MEPINLLQIELEGTQQGATLRIEDDPNERRPLLVIVQKDYHEGQFRGQRVRRFALEEIKARRWWQFWR